MSAWIILAAAIVFEVMGTTAMKLSDGMTKTWPSTWMVIFYCVSFWLLSLTLRHIDVGLAYAIWAGLGTALIAIVGVLLFKEPMTWLKAGSLLLIIVGVIGLKLSNSAA